MYSKHKCTLGLKLGFGLKWGFSLVELMISLIVVSVVAAAFSPVITKKLSSNTVVAGATKAISSIRSDCANFNTSGGVCSVCTDSLCLSCTLDNCDENQGKYKNIGKCSCEACTLRSANCVKCNSKDCTKCAENYYLDSSSKCQSCPSGKYCDGSNSQKNCTSNCKTCNSSLACENCSSGYYLNNSSCISCSAGYFCDGSTNQTICENNQYSTGGSASCQDVSKVANCKTYFKTKNECQECNEKYYLKSNKCYPVTQVANCSTYSKTEDKCTTCSSGYVISGSKCVVDYYVQIGSLKVTKYNMGDHAKTQIPSGSESGCKKTTSTNCNSNNGNYSGCQRTVCTWEAANAICANYKQDNKTWRLPTTSEMSSWAQYSTGKGENGLMLCDSSSVATSSYCADASPNSASGVWGEKSSSGAVGCCLCYYTAYPATNGYLPPVAMMKQNLYYSWSAQGTTNCMVYEIIGNGFSVEKPCGDSNDDDDTHTKTSGNCSYNYGTFYSMQNLSFQSSSKMIYATGTPNYYSPYSYGAIIGKSFDDNYKSVRCVTSM